MYNCRILGVHCYTHIYWTTRWPGVPVSKNCSDLLECCIDIGIVGHASQTLAEPQQFWEYLQWGVYKTVGFEGFHGGFLMTWIVIFMGIFSRDVLRFLLGISSTKLHQSGDIRWHNYGSHLSWWPLRVPWAITLSQSMILFGRYTWNIRGICVEHFQWDILSKNWVFLLEWFREESMGSQRWFPSNRWLPESKLRKSRCK